MNQIKITFDDVVSRQKMETKAEMIFRAMTPEQRKQHKARYEELLSIIDGTYVPPTPKFGKKPFYPTPMPWMKDAWRSGLDMVTKIMTELNEL